MPRLMTEAVNWLQHCLIVKNMEHWISATETGKFYFKSSNVSGFEVKVQVASRRLLHGGLCAHRSHPFLGNACHLSPAWDRSWVSPWARSGSVWWQGGAGTMHMVGWATTPGPHTGHHGVTWTTLPIRTKGKAGLTREPVQILTGRLSSDKSSEPRFFIQGESHCLDHPCSLRWMNMVTHRTRLAWCLVHTES